MDDSVLRDRELRDRARSDDAALVAYEAKWRRRLERLMHAHPARWRLPGLSDEELVSELTLRMIEAIRSGAPALDDQREGREWGLTFLAKERQSMRRAYKLKVVVADLSPIHDRALNEEDAFLEREDDELRAAAKRSAEESLSRPQRRWLAAMKMTANAGAFFESSGRLNLSEAARLLDKDRSSAQRAFTELSDHFTKTRRKLEGT